MVSLENSTKRLQDQNHFFFLQPLQGNRKVGFLSPCSEAVLTWQLDQTGKMKQHRLVPLMNLRGKKTQPNINKLNPVTNESKYKLL